MNRLSAGPATSWPRSSGWPPSSGCGGSLVRVFDIPAFELPPPSRILQSLADDPGFYARNAWVTGREALLGFALALLLALVAGHGDDLLDVPRAGRAAGGRAHPGDADHRLRARLRDLARAPA